MRRVPPIPLRVTRWNGPDLPLGSRWVVEVYSELPPGVTRRKVWTVVDGPEPAGEELEAMYRSLERSMHIQTGEPMPEPTEPTPSEPYSQGPKPRHPATVEMMRYFEYTHLPLALRRVSQPCGDLAQAMVDMLPDGPQLTTGLRKLLEAKDCFVRAALPRPPEGE